MPKNKKKSTGIGQTKKKASALTAGRKKKQSTPSDSSEREEQDEPIRLKWLREPPPGWRFDFNPNGPRNSDKSAPFVLIDHEDEEDAIVSITSEEFNANSMVASTSTAAGQPVQSSSNGSNARIRSGRPAASTHSGRPAARNNAAPAARNAAPQTVPMTIEEHFTRFGALTHEARIAGAEDFIVGRRPAKCRITLDDADEAYRCPICFCLQTYPVSGEWHDRGQISGGTAPSEVYRKLGEVVGGNNLPNACLISYLI
ncbi:hypothetical protein R3P38DRAFT_2815305 [Favolaschia claudopus]|uniref:Uncharacterized protein n=1 Tax=Favolaschia claudopus TaxID=2862362 RepID=A0AAV9Z1K8_9AGAR